MGLTLMHIFDAHCHLDQLPSPDEAIRRAQKAGVERLLAVSEGLESSRKTLELKGLYPGVVLAGLGVHPMYSVHLSLEEVEGILGFLNEHLGEADVLGEVGLDFKYAKTQEQKTFQIELFEHLLDLAKKHQKPVNLHSRWAQRQVMERAIRFKKETGLKVLLHWFTSSKKLIRICAEEELFVSVGPSVLMEGPACEVCLSIPDSLLLVETDSPVPFGGEPAEPAWAMRVLERLAELRGVDPLILEKILNENFQNYLG